MQGMSISVLDQVIVVAYFVLIFAFGSYFGKYIKNTTDFFFSGRKFSWWLIAFSMVATAVGSYSFIKYSAAGYSYGLSSSMSYVNDWFFMPLWMFMWLPIIYFTRLRSIPEYFERRFDTRTRVMAIIFITVYLVGQIGINFYTLGTALKALLGWDVMFSATLVAMVTAIYVTSGGNTAVIMTDLVLALLLLAAGITVFIVGFSYLGEGDIIHGISRLWEGLPEDHRYGLAHFNDPPSFSFIGVFWQDAIVGTFAGYFFNQGILMRFLSAKSVHEGRKGLMVALVVLFPLAVIAVGNAGWLGAAMYNLDMVPAGYANPPDPNDIFVIITHILSRPGVFGLVMAALLAALMSTADALINATSAVVVSDILQPYLARGRSDRFYLRSAQVASMGAALLGLALVPMFMRFNSIYVAHATFIAAVTPPMAACVLLGFLWPRFTARAAFATLLGGGIAMIVSLWIPEVIVPFAHGMDPDGDLDYMRALYGLVVSGVIGVIATFVTRPSHTAEQIMGLTVATVREAERRFKGGEPNRERGGKVRVSLRVGSEDEARYLDSSEGKVIMLSLHPDDLEVLKARPGDMIYLADHRWWLGGLRAAHARVLDDKGEKGQVTMPASYIERNTLRSERDLVVEKIM